MSRFLKRALRVAGVALVAAAVAKELSRPREEREWQGELGGLVPYDFRPPTPARVLERWWNPDDPRLFTPHVFGVGWSLNLARLARLFPR